MPAPLLTNGNVIQYLDEVLGMKIPEVVVTHAVEKVSAYEAALTAAGYVHADMVLIELYSAVIIAAAGSPRRIQSQGAPSGASRSFQNDAKALIALRNALTGLDTAGVMVDAVGPDPSQRTMLMVV